MGASVLCLLPRMDDTRIARRVAMLREAGCAVEAAAFSRDDRAGAGQAPECPVTPLGRIRRGRYAARIPRLLGAARAVRAMIRRHDAVYAFGPDLAILALLAGAGMKRPVILEVADVMRIQVADGWAGRAVRGAERLAAERCALLVLTTAGYLPYYRDWLGVTTPDLIIENKVDAAFAASARNAVPDADAPADGAIRIGWFGTLQDDWPLRVLEALTAAAPDRFRAVIAGVPTWLGEGAAARDALSRQVAGNPRIHYRGAYRYPDDLPALYGGVDTTMACYSPEIPDGWSQSNRFYEACLFRAPLIVREGCEDAVPVRRNDIGLVLPETDADEAAARILGASAEHWARWRANMAALPPRVYASIDEPETLRRALAELTHG